MFLSEGLPRTPIYLYSSSVTIDKFDSSNIRSLLDRGTIRQIIARLRGEDESPDPDMDSGSKDSTDSQTDMSPDSSTMPEGNPEKADYTYSVTSDRITITQPDGRTASIDMRGFTNVQLDPKRQVLFYLYNGDLYQKNWSGDAVTTRKLIQLGPRIGDLIYLPSSGRIYFSDQSDERNPSIEEYDPATGKRRTLAQGSSPTPGTLSVREDGTLMWMESRYGSPRLIQLSLRDLTQQTVDLPNSFTGEESKISYLNTGSGGFIYFLRDGQFMRYNFETRRVEVIESGPVRFISRAVPRLGGVFYITSDNRVSSKILLFYLPFRSSTAVY